MRGFPATVSNHVKDLLRHYRARRSCPRSSSRAWSASPATTISSTAQPDAPHTRAVTDAMAERLTLIGTAAEVRDKIAHLEAAGVTHVCLYLGIVEPELPLLDPGDLRPRDHPALPLTGPRYR